MKHLKKFNESVNIEDIKDMFLEVTDIPGASLDIKEIKDDFGGDFEPEIRLVAYNFTISLDSPFTQKGNPYSSTEVDIVELRENILGFSNLITKSSNLISECLERVINAGYKISFYEFRSGTEASNFPKKLLISFVISV